MYRESSGPCNATLEIDFALSDKLTSDKTFFNAKFYNQSICCPRFKHPPTLLTSREDDDDVRSTRLILNEQKSSSTPVSTIMRNTFKGFATSTTAIPTTTTENQDERFTSGFPESSSHPLGLDDSSVEAPQETTEREEDSLDDDVDSMEDGNIQLSVDTEIEKENVTDAVIKVENTAEVELEGKKSVDAFSSVPAPNLSPNKCRHQIYGMPRGHWPWMVALVISSRHICSGALIDEKYVITAAHCVYLLDDTDMKKLRIIIGDRVMYSTVDGPHFWRKVTKIITHVNYNQQTFASDIAILKMNSNVPYSRNVQPISLSDLVSPVDNNFGKGIVAGWSGADIGQPAFEARAETETVVDIMDKAECREAYRGFALSGVATNTFCTRAANNTCVADSGAPLILRVQNCWVLGGLMSWGLGCSHFPEVYTDVTRYTSWIRKHAI